MNTESGNDWIAALPDSCRALIHFSNTRSQSGTANWYPNHTGLQSGTVKWYPDDAGSQSGMAKTYPDDTGS